MKTDDEILTDHQNDADKNWGRLVVLTKKYFDYWALKTIKPHWNEMKLSYMPVISNVSLKGSTSNEIAKRSLTAKQALSVTIKELERKNMVVTTAAKRDKRSHKINLTEQGKKLMLVANQEINSLTDEYIKLVGKQNFETTLSVLQAINQYHETMNSLSEEDDH
ncbi:MarR family transcriptional regulator [Mucilaginibacter terrenus]|uniref:MarR family transcriptional regulator n=1 Tax=Mucilaginibacter terrenus TaxID=2482727 RepID=A0A3E2NR43_9SPHI|nr:MarR family transcriptional regulator [Mucilaginibacter terrenus]RFZ83456.1 MarR family transcriptional regulator [Mucilaginibacter terrenus]